MGTPRLRGWFREDKRGDGTHPGRRARAEMPSHRADGRGREG
jgi:hypothetical protein